MQTIKEQIMDIIRDPSKTHRQTVFALAELADRLCDYPAGIPENFQRLADEEILCDHNDGHAPLCPRYILPDYERFMERGCDFLRLPAPRTLAEALASLTIFYTHVPSITHFPVYIGRLDRLLEPFVQAVGRAQAREPLRLFLIGLDRIIGDSFCHANIGPEQTVTGELIVELLPELQNAVPNLTLLYDPAVTPDDFAIRCISCALRCANPAFAFDPYYRARIGEQYGIASCYNGLYVGGGAFSLSRIRLGKIAERCTGPDDFFFNRLPESVDAACRFMEAKIRFIAEEIPFFKSNFLVREGFLHRDKFVGLFGLVGMNECVNTLMDLSGDTGRYGPDERANQLGLRIMESIEKQVQAFESRYCAVNGHRFLLHAQVGAVGDNGVTPGVRIAIGSELPLYDHLRQAGLFHHFFPSGVGDIFPFDQTAVQNPTAVLDIFKGAFRCGMQYISTYESASDVIRVAGYLIKRSDFETMQGGAPVINSAVAASRETIEQRHTYNRMVRGVPSTQAPGSKL